MRPTLTADRRARTAQATILLCLLVVAPLLLTPWVHGDGIGYVAYLRSVVLGGDLDLAGEFEYLSTHMQADAGGLPGRLLRRSEHESGIHPTYHRPAPDPVTGRVPSNFSIGPAIVWAPAYIAAHAVSHLGRALGLPLRTDGYGGLYYLAIALTSLACGVIGLLLAFRLASSVVPVREALWATLAIAAASPLLYYLYMAPSYSHAITVLTAAGFLLYWVRTQHSRAAGVWFRRGLLAGLLFTVRWNDLVIAVPAFVLELVRILRAKDGERSWGRAAACVGAAAAGFLLVAAVQLAIWQYFHGRPWVRHPVDYVRFTPEGIWGTLVSARHGLFVWTPITLLSVIGLFRLLRRDHALGGVCLATFGVMVLSNCVVPDWWGGAAFGMRRLVSATPLFILGLGVLLDDIRLAWERGRESLAAPRILAPLVFVVFGVWNALLLVQYGLGMISHLEPVSFGTIAANQPAAVARLFQALREIAR